MLGSVFPPGTRGGIVASRLWARLCLGPFPCWAEGPVGGLNGRWAGDVPVPAPFEEAARGPVGILEGPLGVADAAEPDIWRGGAWFHPPLPPRELKEEPLDNGT